MNLKHTLHINNVFNKFKAENLLPVLIIVLVVCSVNLSAQNGPVIKVDLDKASRPLDEVNEPGYTSWAVNDAVSVSKTFEGVNVTFTRVGPIGADIINTWWKAGVQTPYYARLANDGIEVQDGNAGAQIEMKISDLPAGNHTILTYHNIVHNLEGTTYSPIDIYVNGNLVENDFVQSNRATANSEMPSAYFKVSVTEGEVITILFAADEQSTADFKNVAISGFEINTANKSKQARNPEPKDGDEHVENDGSYKLSWEAAPAATSHYVYFGNKFDDVATATTDSDVYQGNQTETSFTVDNLYSMQSYYWRIDEFDGSEITKGDVWYFKPAQLAFPGAEGYGRFAIGGRGGKVVKVTNLEDTGPGSLREAITNDIGPRTIIFDVSGRILLRSRLTLSQPYVTVAGQTAPGKGICISEAPFGLSGVNDAIVRHMRVRVGIGITYDGMGLQGSDHSIIDHSSISWAIDEGFSSRSGKNITLQRTLISEALNAAGHQNYPAGNQHGYAASIGGDIGSFHHNLLAHNYGRNWSLAGGLDGDGYYAGRLDIFNNVVYNWDNRTTDGGAMEVNFVNNYYKTGPATTWFKALTMDHEGTGKGMQRAYFEGNLMPGYFGLENQEVGRLSRIRNGAVVDWETFVEEPFFPSYAEIETAEAAYKNVLSDVGATQPVFDDHDKRMVEETLTKTFTYYGSVTNKPGLPDNEADVGGYEDYPIVVREENYDSDDDGLPDWWEQEIGTNINSAPGDFSDSNADTNYDGYTNLEVYLNWMANPHYMTTDDTPIEIDLNQYIRGYTNGVTISLSDAENGTTQYDSSTKVVTFNPVDPGMAEFKFTVTDADGDSMTRTIGLYVANATLGIDDENVSFVMKTFPNPTKNSFELQINSQDQSKIDISITDLSGKLLHRQIETLLNQNNRIKVNISNLASGIYFTTISVDNRQQTIKIIKQ